MAELNGPRLEPRSGQAKRLVVFLHGYGADGNDLIGLAPVLVEEIFRLIHGLKEQGLAIVLSEQNARTRMLIVNKAGHFHYREYPDEWVRNVLNFLGYWQ